MYLYDVLLAQGLTYKDEEGNEMIEFCIDAIADEKFKGVHCLIHGVEMENDGLGPNQSWFCKDKLKKFLAWQATNGNFLCRPKNDSSGVM
eukprot:15355916-Ditylum_brightwellii.AAC.1